MLNKNRLTFKWFGLNCSRFGAWCWDTAFVLSKDSVFISLLLLHCVVGEFKALEQQGSSVLLVTRMMKLMVKMTLIMTTMTTLPDYKSPTTHYTYTCWLC